MRFFTYTLVHDTGFAPNPFHGFCTLSCCKPQIRKTARPHDWVIGLTPTKLGSKLIYAMRVSERLTFADYLSDPRFAAKKPRREPGRSRLERRGDNCYEPLAEGGYRPLRSSHFDGPGDPDAERHYKRDLAVDAVLVAGRFAYFGEAAQPLDEVFKFAIVGRAHRVSFTPEQEGLLLALVDGLKPGVHGRPRRWNAEDESWRTPQRCA